MQPQEIITKKRDGRELSHDEIRFFIDGVTDGSWTDPQISALLMAMFICTLSVEEQNHLTGEMLLSGKMLSFSDIDSPKADKHSTGGVGDKTSLIIAPLLASCGIIVPMISGRGLGHTGGTLDKLESIPGYQVDLPIRKFKEIVRKCGFAMVGQTEDIAPADKKLYSLRDATATVASIPLIVASIMSKKLAEGLDALVLDVKTGSGAFMRRIEEAKRLAEALVATGKHFGKKVEAVVSDMNQPLGKFAGNALEVFECVKILRGESDRSMVQTLELSLDLAERILVMCGTSDSLPEARKKLTDNIDSGSALEKFRQNVELQGGDPSICDRPELLLDEAILKVPITAPADGFIAKIDARIIGEVLNEIGSGRARTNDPIDHFVGYSCDARIGDEVHFEQQIGILYCRNQNQADSVIGKLADAYKIEPEKPQISPLVKLVVQ